MKNQFQPFLIHSPSDEIPNLIWATDDDHAYALYRQRWPEKNVEVSISRPRDIFVHDEMIEPQIPHNLRGEVKTTSDSYAPQILVPNFLKRRSSAVIYARVSTPRQAKNSSFARQTGVCGLFAQTAGLNVVQTYTEVESGALYKSRTQLQSALNDLESGRAEVLLVESHDRLSRNAEASQDIFSRVQNSKACIVTVMEQVMGSAESDFAARIFQSLKTYNWELAQEWGLTD